MKRFKGPELKAPNLKVPAFLEDVWWDLRERGLLPLVALIVVAIPAVPLVLAAGSSDESSPAVVEGGAAVASTVPDSAALTVVEAKPGLRDYRRRLVGRSPSDPFVQHHAEPVTKDATLNPIGESSGSGSSGGGEEVTVGGGELESEPPAGGDSGEPVSQTPSDEGGEPELTFFAFAAEIKLVRAGGKDSKSTQKVTNVRERVMPQTPLPGEKAEVVTYMGVSEKQRALLLVSTHVESIFGEARCLMGDEVCQLVEVEEGFPVTFVYGANETRYTVNVLKIEPVVTGRSK